MPDGNRPVALDGVGLVDITPVWQRAGIRPGIGSNVGSKQMELPPLRCRYTLVCQTRKLLVRQRTLCDSFVERSVVPPKMWAQAQFHHAPGCGVAAERIYQIHQRVGSFTVVKVLVHFVPELRQLVCLHKLQLYAAPLFKQILSKVQFQYTGFLTIRYHNTV